MTVFLNFIYSIGVLDRDIFDKHGHITLSATKQGTHSNYSKLVSLDLNRPCTTIRNHLSSGLFSFVYLPLTAQTTHPHPPFTITANSFALFRHESYFFLGFLHIYPTFSIWPSTMAVGWWKRWYHHDWARMPIITIPQQVYTCKKLINTILRNGQVRGKRSSRCEKVNERITQ